MKQPGATEQNGSTAAGGFPRSTRSSPYCAALACVLGEHTQSPLTRRARGYERDGYFLRNSQPRPFDWLPHSVSPGSHNDVPLGRCNHLEGAGSAEHATCESNKSSAGHRCYCSWAASRGKKKERCEESREDGESLYDDVVCVPTRSPWGTIDCTLYSPPPVRVFRGRTQILWRFIFFRGGSDVGRTSATDEHQSLLRHARTRLMSCSRLPNTKLF